MDNSLIVPLLCKKNDISYIIFDQKYKIIDFNEDIVKISDNRQYVKEGKDVREAFWELTGTEDNIKKLFNSNQGDEQVINIPMVYKNNAYYDIEIELCKLKDVQKILIAYFNKKSEFSINYTNTIQEMNKKTLLFENSDETTNRKEQYYNLINQTFISFNVDPQGIITEVNDSCLLFFGIEKAEMLGRHFSNFFETRESNLSAKRSKVMRALNNSSEHTFFHTNVIPVTKDNLIYENIIICQDITYLKKMEEELKYAAGHDSLTGLPNRSNILEKIDNIIQNSHESGKTLSLCHANINNFKFINDEYGNHAGDMLLKHISAVLNSLVRENDKVSRIGGDEFIILLEHEKNKNYTLSTIERIHNITKKTPLIYSEEDTICYDFCIVTSSYPDNGCDAKTLLNYSEKEMHKAKKQRQRN
jgi:diguanylate cyclase (GGDEF)-like protein/PAS domain S-box-containing protein